MSWMRRTRSMIGMSVKTISEHTASRKSFIAAPRSARRAPLSRPIRGLPGRSRVRRARRRRSTDGSVPACTLVDEVGELRDVGVGEQLGVGPACVLGRTPGLQSRRPSRTPLRGRRSRRRPGSWPRRSRRRRCRTGSAPPMCRGTRESANCGWINASACAYTCVTRAPGIEPAQRVEVVDQRLVEDRPRLDPGGDLGGDAGVAGQRPQQLRRADRALDDPGAHVGEVPGEAAVEADLQRHPRVSGGVDRAVGVVQCQRHRLLAEHVLARLRCSDDQVGVGGGGRADRHRIDRPIGDQVQWIAVRPRRRKPFCRARFGVGDGGQAGVRQATCQGLGVEVADPAGADEAEATTVLTFMVLRSSLERSSRP